MFQLVFRSAFLSGLTHGVALAVLSGMAGARLTTPPATPGITLATSWLASTAAPSAPGEVPEISSQVLVMPESARIDERHYEFEPPPRRDSPIDVVVLTGELPPPGMARVITGDANAPEVQHHESIIPRRAPPAASIPVLASLPTPQAVGTTEDQLPRLVSNPPPVYPPQARLERRQGTVVLELQIAANGLVSSILIAKSSGHPILDAAARRAVQSWQFQPGLRDGVAVSMAVRLPVRFLLD